MRRLLVALALLLLLGVAAPSYASAQLGRSQVKGFLLSSPGVSPRVKATIRNGGFHAGIDRLLRADLTGDGRPETVVTIFSGGTAGDIAFYVLTGQGSGVHFIKAANQEYKVGVKVVGGKLQVTRPIYRASDPNCCPAHLEITTYRYDGVRLVSASKERIKTPG
jgi:hypothetical protein